MRALLGEYGLEDLVDVESKVRRGERGGRGFRDRDIHSRTNTRTHILPICLSLMTTHIHIVAPQPPQGTLNP